MSEGLFPIIHSLPSGEALIKKILPEYPILNPRRCCLHKRGLNDTYLVETDAEPYILRIYRSNWRSKDEIDFELELLTFLHQQRLPLLPEFGSWESIRVSLEMWFPIAGLLMSD